MARASHSAFSQDGKFLAVCGTDGKLRIWDTSSSRLKQEFVPNLHLSSPCSVLGWILVGTTAASPWKKRRKKSTSEDTEHKEIVAMGSTNGTITLYDVSTSSISDQLENGHSSSITALTWSSNTGLFTAAEDKQIVEWNLQEKSVKWKWKAGKRTVTSLAVLPEGKSLLSGERTIKWWDLETKQVIGTFIGHVSQVNALSCAKVTSETSYLFSSGSGDNYLSVWSLNEAKKDKVPVATLTLLDEAVSFSVKSTKDSQILVLSVTRSGHAQLFKYQANGTSAKPVKPTLNVMVAADAREKESVQQIPILIAKLTEDAKMTLAYGSFIGLTIEQVVPDFSDKVQCLVRADISKSKEKKEETVTKVKMPNTESEEKIQYLAPDYTGAEEGTSAPGIKRTKSGAGSQLILPDRLENLNLNAETSSPNKKISEGERLAELLLKALHNKDNTVIANVLYNKEESVIKNTVSKLPKQAILPLIKEITIMLHGAPYQDKIAALWLEAVATTHAAHIVSHPNIREALAPILSLSYAKSSRQLFLAKVKGSISLLIEKLAQRAERQEKECLLVYQDQDSSEEDVDLGKVGLGSESDDNWEETSDQEQMQEDVENGKVDDDASMSSSD